MSDVQQKMIEWSGFKKSMEDLSGHALLFSHYYTFLIFLLLYFSWSRHNKRSFLVITTYFSRDLDITKDAFSLSRLIFLVISI